MLEESVNEEKPDSRFCRRLLVLIVSLKLFSAHSEKSKRRADGIVGTAGRSWSLDPGRSSHSRKTSRLAPS